MISNMPTVLFLSVYLLVKCRSVWAAISQLKGSLPWLRAFSLLIILNSTPALGGNYDTHQEVKWSQSLMAEKPFSSLSKKEMYRLGILFNRIVKQSEYLPLKTKMLEYIDLPLVIDQTWEEFKRYLDDRWVGSNIPFDDERVRPLPGVTSGYYSLYIQKIIEKTAEHIFEPHFQIELYSNLLWHLNVRQTPEFNAVIKRAEDEFSWEAVLSPQTLGQLRGVQTPGEFLQWSQENCESFEEISSAFRNIIFEPTNKKRILAQTRIVENSKIHKTHFRQIDQLWFALVDCKVFLPRNFILELLSIYSAIEIESQHLNDAIQAVEDLDHIIKAHRDLQESKDPRSYSFGLAAQMYQSLQGYLANSIAQTISTQQDLLEDFYSESQIQYFLSALAQRGIKVELKKSNLSKGLDHLSKGNLSYLFRKIKNKIIRPNRAEAQKACRLNTRMTSTAPFDPEQNIEQQSLIDDSQNVVAKIFIVANPKGHVTYLNLNTQDIHPSKVSLSLSKPYEIFASAGYADYGVGQWATFQGQVANRFLHPGMKGLAIIDNAANPPLRIVNLDGFVWPEDSQEIAPSRNFSDFEILAQKLSSTQLSSFQSHLIVYEGQSLVSDEWEPEKAYRRLLIEFMDGKYGLVNYADELSLYEAGCLSARIPNIRNALNLDTGNLNYSGYKDEFDNFVSLAQENKRPHGIVDNVIILGVSK